MSPHRRCLLNLVLFHKQINSHNKTIGFFNIFFIVREQCRVLFPYTAANSDELTLTEGDVVTIVSRDVPDQGWWRGELRGRIGLFPDNFVTVLPLPGIISYIPY